MSNKFYQYLTLILVLSLVSDLVLAKSLPIHIHAGAGSVDMRNMTSSFTGNITITQGTLVVHASSGQASQDKDGNKKLVLLGSAKSPVTFQELASDKELIKGRGDRFEYNTVTSVASLIGNARITKGNSLIEGDKLTYNTQTEFYSAATNNDTVSSGQVTIVLDPDDASKSHK